MSLILNGVIKEIGEKQVFDSGYKKVEFILTANDEKYPQDVKFEVLQDNVDPFLNNNKVGSKVEVKFKVRGNEHKEKYYVSLTAWKVSKADSFKSKQDDDWEADKLVI
jgi:single-strand DNA-binding protein